MAQLVRNTDNVRERFTSTGTTISLLTGGVVPDSRGFSAIAGIANGDTLFAVARKGAEISAGIFTYTSGSPGSLAQTTVWFSSNSNAAVSFSSGEGQVFCDAPSWLFDELNLKEITVASATACDIGAVHGAKILISGTTTITGLGTTIDKRRMVRFSGILTLTHHATSLILPYGVNITTAAGDTAIFASDSSGNWRCYSYNKAAAGQITGTATNDSAAAGNVGEYIESIVAFGSAISVTSGGSLDIASISLTAGDWDVRAILYVFGTGTTSFTQIIGSISNTLNTLDVNAGAWNTLTLPAVVPAANIAISAAIPNYRKSLSSTTTVRLVSQATFTVSTAKGWGIISARRVR